MKLQRACELARCGCKPNKQPRPFFISYRRLAIHITAALCDMADTEEPPPEVHHYESLQEVPWDIQK